MLTAPGRRRGAELAAPGGWSPGWGPSAPRGFLSLPLLPSKILGRSGGHRRFGERQGVHGSCPPPGISGLPTPPPTRFCPASAARFRGGRVLRQTPALPLTRAPSIHPPPQPSPTLAWLPPGKPSPTGGIVPPDHWEDRGRTCPAEWWWPPGCCVEKDSGQVSGPQGEGNGLIRSACRASEVRKEDALVGWLRHARGHKAVRSWSGPNAHPA